MGRLDTKWPSGLEVWSWPIVLFFTRDGTKDDDLVLLGCLRPSSPAMNGVGADDSEGAGLFGERNL